ncbi:MAG: ATP-binding protein [Phycisphaerae bacterium]|nr:ATP-binding protein [Phycisphaerae bacterium]NIP52203.1 ATP-binding protein [Phycisphaerae bacterium]NIS51614.1 ATP-binding protein [Phycisphaerae bacterium]NIU09205.1 ATP-binding protein [Phycisphaerae bacterium]NIU56866.1 ATP-binding protein [Phycisphaerae bacterium]
MASEIPVGHETVVGSSSSAVTSVREEILSKLKANSFSEEDIFAVHLALEEAFINAVRHGNRMDSKKGVKIDYSVAPDKVELTVTDEGEGFDPDTVPDPRFGENLFKPEGRGLFLMRSYMDVVKFNERGNSVCMVKNKANQETTNN